MEWCVQLGLTKSIGLSNFNIRQVKDVLEIATIKPVVNQVMLYKKSYFVRNLNECTKLTKITKIPEFLQIKRLK